MDDEQPGPNFTIISNAWKEGVLVLAPTEPPPGYHWIGDYLACDACGALTFETALHDAWHEQAGR